jgi:UDP-2,3-diacylglucosamine hydrolase
LALHFASDLHLGAPDASRSRDRERVFLAWLDQVGSQGDGLHLVGDMIDFWFEWKHVVPKGAVRLLGRIADMVDGGLDVHWHLGNHDMWTKGYLADEVGVHVHTDPIVVEHAGFRCLVGHGDGLGPGDRKYKALKRIFRHPGAQWAYSRLHPNFAFALGAMLSRDSRAAGEEAEAQYDGPEGEWLHHYCKDVLSQETYDAFIFGHRHLPLDLEVVSHDGLRKARYLNCGDWIQHRTFVTLDEKGTQLRHWT